MALLASSGKRYVVIGKLPNQTITPLYWGRFYFIYFFWGAFMGTFD